MFRATMCPYQEKIPYICDAWYLSLYTDVCLVCRAEFHSAMHTRQSSIESDKYQASHRYGMFSWWWALVEKSNKHIKKICATSWLYLKKILYIIKHSKNTVFRRDRIRSEENVMMDFGKTGIEGVDWTSQGQKRAQWRAVVNTVRNFRIHGRPINNFWGKKLFHGAL
jgi:hypothetical protein